MLVGFSMGPFQKDQGCCKITYAFGSERQYPYFRFLQILKARLISSNLKICHKGWHVVSDKVSQLNQQHPQVSLQ